MTRVGNDLKSVQTQQVGAGAVALDAQLSALRQATSLDEIGKQLRGIADQLPVDRSAAGETKAAASAAKAWAGQVFQAAKVAFQGKPKGLRDVFAEADKANVKLFLGTSTPEGAQKLAQESGLEIGRKDFKIFSTGDPFTFLGTSGDSSKKLAAQPENVSGKTVLVVQGDGNYAPAGKDAKYDLPTLVAESLQVAAAAKSNGASRVMLVLPEALDPSRNPDDKFAALTQRLAVATGVDIKDIRYVTGLENRPADGATKAGVRQGLEGLGPKTREVSQALTALESAGDVRGIEKALRQLEIQIGGLRGKHGDVATKLARTVADALALKMQQLVPGFGENSVLTQGNRVTVLSGQSNPALAEDIAQHLGASYGKTSLSMPSGGSPRVDFGANVAGKDVVIVQTSRQDPATEPEARQSSMALLAEALMTFQSAVERGANDVTLVLPYMPNARSDKRDQKGVATYAALVANWVDAIVDDAKKLQEARGKRLDFTPRVVMVEPHDPHVPEYFFPVPVDVISGAKILTHRVIEDLGRDNLVLVRPDEGAAKRTAVLGKELKLPVVDGQKMRDDNNETAKVGKLAHPEDVAGKNLLVVDDEIATGGTMRQTVAMLAAAGAAHVNVAVSHANMPLEPEARFDAMRKLIDSAADGVKQAIADGLLPEGSAVPSVRLYLLDTQPVGAIPPDLEGRVIVVSAADAVSKAVRGEVQ